MTDPIVATGPRILRKRVFFYDVAGIEGAEPPYLVLAAVILAVTLAVPVSLVAACCVHRWRATTLPLL